MKLSMKVLIFCHYLQGPAATQYLADLGADVIKVEPLQGAFERHWSGGKSYVGGVSAFLLSANRNKRSLAIDLKSQKGCDAVLKLAERSEEHTSELQSLMRISYAVFCLKKKEHQPTARPSHIINQYYNSMNTLNT